jgi:hypothetical protein
MSDLHDELDREARRVRGGTDTLGSVLRRVRRRRMARRAASGAVALAIGAASLLVAYSAFGPGGGVRPAGSPTPGPTPTTDDETPPPLEIALANGTVRAELPQYAAAVLRYQGVFIRDGGYEIGDRGFPEAEAGPYEVTTFFSSPGMEAEAIRLRDALFPGAELRPASPSEGDVLGLIVGEDFARRHREELRAFAFVREFMEHRYRGSGAEPFLSEQALAEYDREEGGLSLYGYTAGVEHTSQILAWGTTASGSHRAIVRITTEGSDRLRHESLTVAAVAETGGTQWIISDVERNE